MDYYRVEGHSNLRRDPKTNTILNFDELEHNEYVSRREAKSEESKKIQNLESDIANMKGDLDEIKSLLRSILNGPK
jgi:hypothetical protein